MESSKPLSTRSGIGALKLRNHLLPGRGCKVVYTEASRDWRRLRVLARSACCAYTCVGDGDGGLKACSPTPGAANLGFCCYAGQSKICAPPGIHGSDHAPTRAPPPSLWHRPLPTTFLRPDLRYAWRAAAAAAAAGGVAQGLGLREPVGACQRDQQGRVAGGRAVGDRI